MDRTEAIKLLKRLAQLCPLIDEKIVSLNESSPDYLTAKGFLIVISGINKDDKTCLRKAVDQYDYLIKEGPNRLIIYDPAELKCPECGKTFETTRELKTHITGVHYSKEFEQTEMPTGEL